MTPINWYLVRHYLKWTLISVTVLFFLVTVVNLLVIKQFYIKRYIEMHLVDSAQTDSSASFDGKHKVFQVDEEIDLAKFNLSEVTHNQTLAESAPQHHHELPSVLDEAESTVELPEDEERFSSEVKFITGICVAAIILIEALYCLLYLYIIAQKRFCPMLAFALLSALSLIFHIQLHLTLGDEDQEETKASDHSPADSHHRGDSFMTHIDSLDPQSLVNHLTRSSLTEVVLSTVETVLALAYSAILYSFPGRQQSAHYRLRGFFRLGGGPDGRGRPPRHELAANGRLPNGHAMAIEMNSIDEPIDEEEEEEGEPPNQQSDTSSESSSSHLNDADQVAPSSSSAESLCNNNGGGRQLPVSATPTDPLIDDPPGSAPGLVIATK